MPALVNKHNSRYLNVAVKYCIMMESVLHAMENLRKRQIGGAPILEINAAPGQLQRKLMTVLWLKLPILYIRVIQNERAALMFHHLLMH